MKKLIFVLTLVISTAVTVNAQDYNTGIGVRGGIRNGLTVKHFISSNKAIEGILTSHWKWHGYGVTGLYEIHAQAFNTPRLNWYYGFGGHFGSYGDDNKRALDGNRYSAIGLDGIIGIEYNVIDIPFNISLDWKPSIDLIGDFYPWADEVALSIRFIF
ncbi:MAG: hypothetical protein K0B11_15130 [Mariniphaga sp.]|nr:hypothetical protein [Mariniphaga sp.]